MTLVCSLTKSYILEIMDELTNFLAQHPHIHHATPSSPDYDNLCPGYALDNAKVPAMIVRPRSADDVAALVAILKANDLPFSVRIGGHDMFGRSQVHDAITVGLREITYGYVNPETHTARLGGGVLVMEVLKELKNMAWSCLTLSSQGLDLWAGQPMVDMACSALNMDLE
jgi:FAD/FMN-containing dehydrogenase